jgi:hypothetical protein
MKILITGASGFIGTIVRDVYEDCDVTLLTRSRIPTRKNEKLYQSRDIGDGLWWAALPPKVVYDIVFHLAEPTKQVLKSSLFETVVEGHIKFITHILNYTSRIVYPLTAYLYDEKLSNRNESYAKIKKRVYLSLCQSKKISFPVIHPLFDCGSGLNLLINIHRMIPCVNIFCCFNAHLPVLKSNDFKIYISSHNLISVGKLDLYSELITISNIFLCPEKRNIWVLSNILYGLMKMFRMFPSFRLLTSGRTIRQMII